MLAESGEVTELSLRAVAREVGVAATSIYLHFRTMDELILAVKVGYFDEFGAALDAAADAAGDVPMARALARAHRYVRYGMENRGRYRVMFASEMLPAHVLEGAPHIGLQAFEAVRDEIATVVAPDRDVDMIAVHTWTALHGIVTLRTVRGNFPWPDLDREVDNLIELLLPSD